MDNNELIEKFFNQLYEYDTIASFGFKRYKFEKFSACAAGLLSHNSGKKIICSFNIYDDDPETVELNIQFHNNYTTEQLKITGSKVAQMMHKEIKVVEFEESMEYFIYYDIDEINDAVGMLITILDEISKVVTFIIN